MRRSNRTVRWRRLSLVVLTVVGVTSAGLPPAARAAPTPPAITDWITRNAEPIRTVDPDAPLDDLAALRRAVGDATVVGLGESTHGAREEILLKHRVLRFLVEERGFRSIAWEDDWSLGLQVNRYILTGEGDLDALTGELATTWRSREVGDVLRWLRRYNASHDDKVQFVGVEFFATRDVAYDAVADHVAEVAPRRLGELNRHLEPLRPRYPTIGEHVGWYYALPDKQPYIRHARRVHDLVERLPHRRGDRAHELALHHARQIRSFYEYFALQGSEQIDYRDVRAAENVRWWRQRTGDRIAYWAASAHTANAPGLVLSAPPDPEFRWDSAGSHLRRWYGRRYLSIGFTFDHGTVNINADEPPFAPEPADVPRPPRGWAERPFGDVDREQFWLDLRADAPPAVQAWRTAPTRTRALAGFDPQRPDAYHMTGGSLAQWFDVIVHRQVVTPWRPL